MHSLPSIGVKKIDKVRVVAPEDHCVVALKPKVTILVFKIDVSDSGIV